MTALLEYIDLYNKFSRSVTFLREVHQLPRCALPYTITYSFYPATHTKSCVRVMKTQKSNFTGASAVCS